MTQPVAPVAAPPAREVVLGPGAHGDPQNAGWTYAQYEASNPSSAPVVANVPVAQDSTPVGDQLPPVLQPVPAVTPAVA